MTGPEPLKRSTTAMFGKKVPSYEDTQNTASRSVIVDSPRELRLIG
jgi:hypothetical protein